MRLCDSIGCPPAREYQILYNMAHSAQNLRLNRVAIKLMQTGEKVIAQSGDVTAHAYALETLAIMSGRAAEYNSSDSYFRAAINLARTGLKSSLAALYVAEWQADQADILLRKGDPAKISRSASPKQQASP